MLTLEDKLKNLPEKPGVYIMRDEYNEIIYIGKAISLKNRVRQYFQSSRGHTPKVRAMVERIRDLEYIITDSELEALILECNLIKTHRPHYNILLKDDKHYPYIKVTMEDDYPRIMITRSIKKDGSKYFGPYTDSDAVHKTIELLKNLFPIRSCSKNIEKVQGKERPCLNYQIKRCLAPCQGNVNIAEYKEMMKDVCTFLDGKVDDLLSALEGKMEKAAEGLDFERAADLRDQINAVKRINQKQKIISSALLDQDIIAFAKENSEACVQVFFIRGGKLIGREHFFLTGAERNDDEESHMEILSSFIKQFYAETSFVPKEIILQEQIDEINIIESWLSSKRGSKVKIVVPQKGEKHKLVEMVCKNAEDALQLFIDKNKKDIGKTIGACRELAEYLCLDKVLDRIEAYDISNIRGVDSVGSMIVFQDGRPSTKEYRRFKIKTVDGSNDYESMREIIERRIVHGQNEIKKLEAEGKDLTLGKFSILPDLIMIDGGLGHVNAVIPILEAHNINIPVCGIVKDDKHRTRGIIYQGDEIKIPIASNAFRLITNIQDEAHRFAITYHKSLREKSTVKSILDDIPGVGMARKKALIKHFGSVEKIKRASAKEISEVKGINEALAIEIYNFLSK